MLNANFTSQFQRVFLQNYSHLHTNSNYSNFAMNPRLTFGLLSQKCYPSLSPPLFPIHKIAFSFAHSFKPTGKMEPICKGIGANS